MQLERLFAELKAAAEKVGITVREEPMVPTAAGREAGGGLCKVRGERLLFVDADAPLPDRIATVAAALASVDLDEVYVPPLVRATIGAHARGGKGRGPAPAPRPLARARRRD